MQQIQTNAAIAQSEQSMKKDPGSVATRRCLESGRSETECLGEGMKVGLVDLAGGNPSGSIGLPGRDPGLRLTGVYSSGNFSLTFSQTTSGVACGTLLPQQLPYSVERSGNQVLVKVPIQPKPLVLSYKGDGKLAGPGPTDVAGRVVAGRATDTTSTSYEMETRKRALRDGGIGANEVPNYNADQVHQNGMEYSVNDQTTSSTMVPTTVHNYSVPTAPKTERCNVGVLPPTGESGSVSGALTQVLGSQASKSANTAPGLRLSGTYSVAGGLKIEFRDDSATLECGAALSSEGYAVVPEGGQLVVKFRAQRRAAFACPAAEWNSDRLRSGRCEWPKNLPFANRRHRLHAAERPLHIRYADAEQVNKVELCRKVCTFTKSREFRLDDAPLGSNPSQ